MADKSASLVPEVTTPAEAEAVKKAPSPNVAKPVTVKALKAAKALKLPKDKPTHPSTAVMVNNAIQTLAERKGSSLQAIKKYLVSTYKLDTIKYAPFIKKYLKSAVASGVLVQTKGKGASGSFKLAIKKAEAAKPKPKAAVKKPTAPKKSAVKKPAAKKAETAKTAAKKPASPKKSAAKKPAIREKKAPAAAKVVKPKSPKVKKATKTPTAKPKAPKPKKAAVAAKTTKAAPKKAAV